MGNFAREVFEMIRTTPLAIAAIAFIFTLNPSTASAQDDCFVYYNRVDEETGETIRVCAQNARQTTVATAFVGSIDRARGVTSSVSPNRTSATVSPAVDAYPYGHGGVPGGYYPPQDDPRLPFALSEAYKAGITVTAFKREWQAAADRGASDGQHAAEMAAIESLRAEIARQRSYFAGAIVAGNADLERKFGVRIADLERQLAAVQAPPPATPTPTPGEKTVPTPAAGGGPTVQEYFERRLPQSRSR